MWLPCLLWLCLTAPCLAATLTTVEGRAIAFTGLETKDGRLTVQAEGGATTLALTEVLSLDFGFAPANLLERPGQHVIVTDDGSVVGVAGGTVSDGKLQARTAFGVAVTVPQERIARWLRTRPQERPAELEARAVALKLSRGDQDCAVLSKDPEQWTPVQGILVSATEENLRLNYQGTETSFESTTVPIVVMAKMGAPPGKTLGRLQTRDGSQLAFTAVEFGAKQAVLQTAAFGRLALTLDAVGAVRFSGERLTALSDLEWEEVRQTGFFDEQFPPRKDACVAGGPLRLNGVDYPRGLGLHSRGEASFHLGGAYRAFSARAGIDDTGVGAAFLSVLGDGKPLVSRLPLKRPAPPQPLRVELGGVQRLTLVVDFGENSFGAGERVDVVEAVLVK